MKILSIVGARPQFIKAAPVGQELVKRGHKNVLVHTGQHYDYMLSKVFFDELNIPEPDFNLEVGANKPVLQMAAMMRELLPVVDTVRPAFAIVYGDTNSTLAAAVTLLKLGIPFGHIEGGERNFSLDMNMVHPSSIPEEANRVLVDHISEMIFCASKRSVQNLENEGVTHNVHWVGDVMLDTFSQMSQMAETRSSIIKDLDLKRHGYSLATVHRAINTDDPERLRQIIHGLRRSELQVILPIHPRTRKVFTENGLDKELIGNHHLRIIEPVGYFDMLELEKNARVIVTDSGGVTREAFFAGVPSIIVDDTTAWIDLVQTGWSRLVGADAEKIRDGLRFLEIPLVREPLLGYGNASEKIICNIEKMF